MVAVQSDNRKRRQLISEGYCVFKDVLAPSLLDDLRRVTDAILDKVTPEEAHRVRYQGSNIGVAYQDPVFARLYSWPKALESLAELGFAHPKWWSGVLLSKPPHAPPLYWHQDWWVWHDPISADPVPAQVFLMVYLTDTTPENGCLRVIPGTHVRRVPLHDLLPAAHTEKTYEADADSPLFCDPPGAIDVPVQAGDLVIGDARLLHAAHANCTDRRRTLLTLWYFPDYDHLPDSIKTAVARKTPLELPNWWEGEAGKRMEPLIPLYSGNAEPAKWNREPGEHLKPTPAGD